MFNGSGLRRESHIRRIGVAHRKCWTVGVSASEQDRYAVNMQRVRDARSHSFNQRTGFHHPAYVIAKFAQDLLSVVGFTKKTAIGPLTQAVPKPRDAETNCDCNPNHDHLASAVGIATQRKGRGNRSEEHTSELQS